MRLASTIVTKTKVLPATLLASVALSAPDASVRELGATFAEAVDDIETYAKLGRPTQKPYAEKLLLRVAPALHARAAAEVKMSCSDEAKNLSQQIDSNTTL